MSEPNAKVEVTHSKVKGFLCGELTVRLVTDNGTWLLRRFSYGAPYAYPGCGKEEQARAETFARAVAESLRNSDSDIVVHKTVEKT